MKLGDALRHLVTELSTLLRRKRVRAKLTLDRCRWSPWNQKTSKDTPMEVQEPQNHALRSDAKANDHDDAGDVWWHFEVPSILWLVDDNSSAAYSIGQFLSKKYVFKL